MGYLKDEVKRIFETPLMDLLFKSHSVHRQNHDVNKVQISVLCSIKTGACPEDCKYCSQSAHYKTNIQKEPLLKKEVIMESARKAKQSGAERFCMGAAWKKLHSKDVDIICDIIRDIKNVGLETCVTLGSITMDQAVQMKEAGLDYYNHNLDTSEEYYNNIITTRTFQERLDTISNVSKAGINVCCGGILGVGESHMDRISLLWQLANLFPQPDSVPINKLVKVKGTPLENAPEIDNIDFIRTIATARIIMPKSSIRVSAGRLGMSEEMQAMCFFAGANSIFTGEALLTTPNPDYKNDEILLAKLGMNNKMLDKTNLKLV